jgi:crotonobetainyl-CoA:carnitine CoA-transferase CaiB-like acyl-CoA transferase
VAELSATLRERAAAEWSDVLREAGVPCSPVQQVSEVVAHAQTAALGMVAPVPHPPGPVAGHT